MKDRAGNEIPSDQSNPIISYKLGDEAQGYCGLGSGDGPLTSDESYSDGLRGRVMAWRSEKSYDGRFPMLISVSAETTPPGSAHDEIALVGPHTTGKYFRQTDPSWANSTYDKSGKTIKIKGCALTCIAMALDGFGVVVDPKRLNTWMNDSAGYNTVHDVKWSTIGRYPGSSVKDDVPEGGGLTYDEITKSWWSFNPLPSFTRMDNVLAAGSVAIAQVWNPTTKNAHWVLVTGKTMSGDYTILDPGGYHRVTLNASYETIYRYIPIRPN